MFGANYIEKAEAMARGSALGTSSPPLDTSADKKQLNNGTTLQQDSLAERFLLSPQPG